MTHLVSQGILLTFVDVGWSRWYASSTGSNCGTADDVCGFGPAIRYQRDCDGKTYICFVYLVDCLV